MLECASGGGAVVAPVGVPPPTELKADGKEAMRKGWRRGEGGIAERVAVR